VRNSNHERAEYFSYLRTQPLGQSSHALVAQTYPLFSRQTYSSATLPWNRTGSLFTGLAIQNPGANPVEVTVEMRSATGQSLATFSFPLPGLSKITRDLTDLFAQPSAGAASVHITSSQPIQILGFLGDDSTGDVVPVIVSTP
jgi:hypothetical protein